MLNDELSKPSNHLNWVEINDEARGTYSPNKKIKFMEINDEARGTYSPNKKNKFKTSVLRSSLCDYSDAYILVKGNITVNNTAADGADANNDNKKVIFKNCAPFINCISKINNKDIDNAKYIDIVMTMCNLIEYSDNYSKTSGSLWKYCKEIPAINDDGDVTDFNGSNATDSFSFKNKMTGQTAADNNDGNFAGRVDVE